jgi:carotenoid cleavage dioxygenase
MQTLAFDALVKYDHEKGSREVYEYPKGWIANETPFAKSTRGGAEDRGYAVTLATHCKDYASEAWIFDAQRITAGPIARVALPGRVPIGFHAAWIPGQLLWPGTAA